MPQRLGIYEWSMLAVPQSSSLSRPFYPSSILQNMQQPLLCSSSSDRPYSTYHLIIQQSIRRSNFIATKQFFPVNPFYNPDRCDSFGDSSSTQHAYRLLLHMQTKLEVVLIT